MNSKYRKQSLKKLIDEFKLFKSLGKLDSTSEETIRTWLNEFLKIFHWDVRDTSQILQEKFLSEEERERLKEIDSQNIKPDYTFKIAKQKLTFLDAKDTSVNIDRNSEIAFQIKSYGWSILAPCAFISNFEEFAIYDCTYVPDKSQSPTLGRIYLDIENYIEYFEILENHLLKENVYSGKLNTLYSDTLKGDKSIEKLTPDFAVAEYLSRFRIKLANNILSNNRDDIFSNIENLSYFTQVIINRIIFIRVSEARKIETEGLLKQFSKHGFWENFKKSSYFELYEHYDGVLFNRINSIHNLIISDDIFEELINFLYYPSPYKFDVIPTKLLSDIYEIFLSKKLYLENDQVFDEYKSEYSKTKGAVSTPQFIVQDIVKKTINKQEIIEHGINELFNKKILDLACGSGVFLIEAYDYLEDLFIELYSSSNEKDFDQYFIINGNETIINLSGKRILFENCIFGVDIDPEAVEVSRMSLSLKIIESNEYLEIYNEIGIFAKKILKDVGNNIKCGNSLVSKNIIDLYPDLIDKKEELLKTNIFDWDSEDGFKKIFEENGGFDYIISNPPYVEVKNYNIDLPCMHQYIKKEYCSSKNFKIDLAIPFIERSIQLLNEKGRMGFIVQKRFFKTNYGNKIRKLISENKLISSITDFETTSIFKGRITYVSIMILDKTQPNNFFYKKIDDEIDTLPSTLRDLEVPELNHSTYFQLPSSVVTSTPWNFSDPQLLKIRNNLLKLGILGKEFAKVKVGIQVLWDRAYHIRPIRVQNDILIGNTHLENEFEIELEACKPLICNEDFYCFRKDNADVYAIFPYDVENGNVSEIQFSDFENRFPLAAQYLSRNKSMIQENVVTIDDEERWHLYTRVQNHGTTYPKILIPMTAEDTFATVSFSNNIYCDNANVYFIEIKDKTEINLYALAGIINSTLFNILAKSFANPQSKGYFKFNKQFLEPIPFPVKNFIENYNNIVNELAECSIQIKQEQERYLKASPTQKQTIKLLLNRNWNKLDNLVYDLYELDSNTKLFFKNIKRKKDRISILDVIL